MTANWIKLHSYPCGIWPPVGSTWPCAAWPDLRLPLTRQFWLVKGHPMNSYPPVVMTEDVAREYWGGIGLRQFRHAMDNCGVFPIDCGIRRVLYRRADLDAAAHNMPTKTDTTPELSPEQIDTAQAALDAVRRRREETK